MWAAMYKTYKACEEYCYSSSEYHLPKQIKESIEQHYGCDIISAKPLNKGNQGTVTLIEIKGNLSGNMPKKFCVKSLLKSNETANNDFENSKKVYEKKFQDEKIKIIPKLFEDDTHFHFTMPFFEGKLLSEFENEVILTRVTIFKNLMDELSFIHSLCVIHNDLKDANIIVDAKLQVNIIDFGRSTSPLNQDGKPVPFEQLKLPNNNYLSYQFARKFQSQTAPEHSSTVDWLKNKVTTAPDYKNEYNIGFRSDYVGLANLFVAFVPEYSELGVSVLMEMGPDRNAAFVQFKENIPNLITSLQQDKNWAFSC